MVINTLIGTLAAMIRSKIKRRVCRVKWLYKRKIIA